MGTHLWAGMDDKKQYSSLITKLCVKRQGIITQRQDTLVPTTSEQSIGLLSLFPSKFYRGRSAQMETFHIESKGRTAQQCKETLANRVQRESSKSAYDKWLASTLHTVVQWYSCSTCHTQFKCSWYASKQGWWRIVFWIQIWMGPRWWYARRTINGLYHTKWIRTKSNTHKTKQIIIQGWTLGCRTYHPL